MSALDAIRIEIARVRDKRAELEIEERLLLRLLDGSGEPTCIDCGGPRSLGSALRCRECFEAKPPQVSPPALLPPAPEVVTEPPAPAPAAHETRKRFTVPWTDEEEDILRAHWPDAEACVPLLPGRSESSIKQRGYYLRLHQFTPPPVDIRVNAEPPPRAPLGDQRYRENRKPKTFDEQLEAVRNGAPIREHEPIKRPDSDRTLGGVVGEII